MIVTPLASEMARRGQRVREEQGQAEERDFDPRLPAACELGQADSPDQPPAEQADGLPNADSIAPVPEGAAG